MTAPSHPTEPAPGNGLGAPESFQDPDPGTERRPGGDFGPQTGTQSLDFDGCNRDCRIKGAHTFVWGCCEHAPKPEPTVSISVVYQDTDGYPSIGFDTYTVDQLAELIEPALRDSIIPVHADCLGDLARTAAEAIIHRHDKEQQ